MDHFRTPHFNHSSSGANTGSAASSRQASPVAANTIISGGVLGSPETASVSRSLNPSSASQGGLNHESMISLYESFNQNLTLKLDVLAQGDLLPRLQDRALAESTKQSM